MGKNHIKRINAPKRWDILRKQDTFISRPNPGRKLELAISLNTCLKELIGKTKTTKESKYLIRSQGVLINGVRRYDEKFPVGFLDVLSIPSISEHYRLIVNSQNRLELVKITEAESKIKMSKVSNRLLISGGKVQVNCTDGRNFLFDAKKPETAKIGINDTIAYTVPGQEVKDIFKLEKGALVLLYRGRHIGHVVKIEDFKVGNILFKMNGEDFETKKSYAFAIGKEKPLISAQSSASAAEAHTPAVGEASSVASGTKKGKKKED